MGTEGTLGGDNKIHLSKSALGCKADSAPMASVGRL